MKRILTVLTVLTAGACASAPPPAAPYAQSYVVPPPPPPAEESSNVPGQRVSRVALTTAGSTFKVQVKIHTTCCFTYILDSGASDMTVSPAMFKAMYQDGILTDDDLIDVQKYRTADGSVMEGLRFKMPTIQVGTVIARNVVGSVSVGSNVLLLGQSFLRKFRGWSINNQTHELILFY